MAKKIVETPLMKQYFEMKQKHPDAVLLFRVGDFYETFSDDAIAASEILGITLTRRANGSASSVELAGFPHHALDTYLPKLIRAGKRVAICEQLEDPKLTKKLVKRGITELVTPGVSINDNILDNRRNNFLAAVALGPKEWGIAFLDISTGEFMTAEGSPDYAGKLLAKFAPKEVLIERGRKREFADAVAPSSGASSYLTFELDDWIFTEPTARERLMKQFRTASLKGFGVDSMKGAIIASGAILHYLDITNHLQTAHISALSRIDEDRFVRLDNFTVRNLELTDSIAPDGRSLLEVIDRTSTPMGARMLRRWLLFPLKDVGAINARLDVVEHFMRDTAMRDMVAEALMQIGDLERLAGKVAVQRVNPREMVQLGAALRLIAPLRDACRRSSEPTLRDIGSRLDPCTEVSDRIAREIVADPPSALNRGTVIAPGVDAELDELRAIAFSGKDYLMRIQQRESATTGITSLKIGYNNVFGYYIEVTNTHRDKVPPEWIRKQTLVNAERYITPELKEYEEKILGAQEKIEIIESRLYTALVSSVARYIPAIQTDAALVARLDCLLSHTRTAMANRYTRPAVDDSMVIDIRRGRHPVIERELPPGEPYIANSVRLDSDDAQIMMITGPNMSGKSALLRQTALTVLMAQIGSFVAAESARIGIVDKIFTRVGASDNISRGESTFMVEMIEASSILNNLSSRSLVLFDELGRGTSTYDGISIAWAIVEHIHGSAARAKTLFATHYHELNEMERSFPRVVNYNVAVREIDGKVVFLRKLEKGGSAHSFGIHVAKLAGMPEPIVRRANEVLAQLEQAHRQADSQAAAAIAPVSGTESSSGMQLSFFQLDDPVLSQIRDEILSVDINNLTPMAALNKLNEIKTILTGQ